MLRESNAYQILPNLWLGNALAAKNINFLRENDIKYIINLSCDIPNYHFSEFTYLNVSITDSDVTANQISNIFKITNEFIYQAFKNKDAVLVHCKRGHNKSAVIVAAFMVKHLKMDVDTTIRYINSLRRNTFTRETNLTKGLRIYNQIVKTKSLSGGASDIYVYGILSQIERLSDIDAKFWYDVFIVIMNIETNENLKKEYNILDVNKSKFEAIHHFFTFIIFEDIIEGKTKEEILQFYNSEPFLWNKFNASYTDFNDPIIWSRILLNYRLVDKSGFRLPEDEFINNQLPCLNNAVVLDNPKETLKSLFMCLVNVKTSKNLITQINESKK